MDGQSQYLTGGAPAVPLVIVEIDLVACAEPVQFRDPDGAHDHGVGSQHPLQHFDLLHDALAELLGQHVFGLVLEVFLVVLIHRQPL